MRRLARLILVSSCVGIAADTPLSVSGDYSHFYTDRYREFLLTEEGLSPPYLQALIDAGTAEAEELRRARAAENAQRGDAGPSTVSFYEMLEINNRRLRWIKSVQRQRSMSHRKLVWALRLAGVAVQIVSPYSKAAYFALIYYSGYLIFEALILYPDLDSNIGAFKALTKPDVAPATSRDALRRAF